MNPLPKSDTVNNTVQCASRDQSFESTGPASSSVVGGWTDHAKRNEEWILSEVLPHKLPRTKLRWGFRISPIVTVFFSFSLSQEAKSTRNLQGPFSRSRKFANVPDCTQICKSANAGQI